MVPSRAQIERRQKVYFEMERNTIVSVDDKGRWDCKDRVVVLHMHMRNLALE